MQVTLNENVVDVQTGQTILEAANEAGVVIPTLCHHQDLSPVGSCRLCVVEVNGSPTPTPACTTPVCDGMKIVTESTSLVALRRTMLEMLLTNYRPSAMPMSEENEFTRWLRHYDVPISEPSTENAADAARLPARHGVDVDPNPFIRVDLNQCILCTRCVRACEEVQGRFVWGVGYRGDEARVIAGADTTMIEAGCESCGACADYCPTGALAGRAMTDVDPTTVQKRVATTCSYCGVGCRFDLNVSQDRIVAVTSNPDAPVNGKSLCVKGRYGWDYVHHADRLTRPRVRRYLLDRTEKPTGEQPASSWVDVDWETAFKIVADRIVTVKRESGPDAIGMLSSAKCTNEENYLMQKFARQVVGTNNVDHCARLCHSSTVAGLAMAFGSGAMSNSMDDIATHANAVFVIGSNTTEQHPVFGAMIRQSVLRRDTKLVVADPRRIDLCDFAALHIRQRPGTDVALINGLMHIILANDWHDDTFIANRCEDFDLFAETVQRYPPSVVAEITGVSEADLHRTAELLARHRPMAVIWSMGITQHTTGVLNVLSLANLQMLLGNMGVAGGGVNPLRGQNNVQGACDMGTLPNVFSGYQQVADPTTRAQFEDAWRTTGEFAIAERTGLTVTEIVKAAGEHSVRAIYILGEDPAMTEPNVGHVHKQLAAAEFIVLQEIFPSETSHFADVLLPGTTFAEKGGTFTNTERRVQMIEPAITPIGESRPDWAITAELARRVLAIEQREPRGEFAAWDYPSAASIMDEIAGVTPSYRGVNHQRLQRGERLQWPVIDAEHAGTPILHVERFTRGLGKFHAVDHLPPKELPDEEFPLLLTTGRVLYHWHGGELTRRARGLLAAYPSTLVEISSEDAQRLDITDGDDVRVVSRRGEMLAKAVVTDRVSAGVVFGNFHFPGAANVNNLTIDALDPIAKIPEYKVCAVRLG